MKQDREEYAPIHGSLVEIQDYESSDSTEAFRVRRWSLKTIFTNHPWFWMFSTITGLIALAIIVAFLVIDWNDKNEMAHKPLVILVSLDGFKHSYTNDFKSFHPTLNSIASLGVKSMLKPVFPSLTFPNHYSIATGRYPETHGIVSNHFYDKNYHATFSYKNSNDNADPKWWSAGEPIWITAVKQNLTSACFFWPGSETSIDGYHATYYMRYNGSVPYDHRVDQVLEWAGMAEEKRPSLITVYFDIVDTYGHQYGPDDRTQISSAIAQVDQVLKRLMLGLEDLKNNSDTDNVTVIVVSDHGMTGFSTDFYIYLDDYIDVSQDNLRAVDWSTSLLQLWPPFKFDQDNATWAKELFAKVRNVHPNITFYLKEDIPQQYHIANSSRIPPLIGICDEGYLVTTRSHVSEQLKGMHGYDNNLESMAAIFYASGPRLKQGFENPKPLDSVNVYSLIAHILALKPAPNNGSDTSYQDFWDDKILST